MNLRDLLYHLAHGYPGGASALEQRLGTKDKYPQNGLNPNSAETHHINATTVEKLLDFVPAGNMEAAKFFARKANAVVIQLPINAEDASDMELLDGYMNVVKNLGDVSSEFQKSWADGVITKKEYQRLKAEADETMTALMAFMERIGQLVEERNSRASNRS